MLNAYLNFNGNCGEAFRFYERCLGGKITFIQTFGEALKEQAKPEEANLVMHVALQVGNTTLMGSDAPGGRYRAPQGMYVTFTARTAADAQRVFNELASGGKVEMPFQETFFSPGFGMTVDRFGIPWMVNTVPETAAAG